MFFPGNSGQTLVIFCPLSIPDSEFSLAMPVPAGSSAQTPAKPPAGFYARPEGVKFSRALRERHATRSKSDGVGGLVGTARCAVPARQRSEGGTSHEDHPLCKAWASPRSLPSPDAALGDGDSAARCPYPPLPAMA